tara:strand:- start:355 stop:657 length:303 start_codon:yes stop_codon:yes gene_type:complete
MTRTINRAAMTTKTIMQTSTVSEKFDREEDDQGTHEIEDQTNQEMKKMSCNAKWYICNCGSDFSSYDRLEDHIVSHANNGNSGHYYRGRCCSCGCTLIND